MIVYLGIGQVLELHRVQLDRYGGLGGLRDRGALEAAIARPAATFGGDDLYSDVPSKAAALMHSLALNHPFVDGNKRVAAHAGVLFAGVNGLECTASPSELVDVTVRVASGALGIEALAIWFRQRLRPE